MMTYKHLILAVHFFQSYTIFTDVTVRTTSLLCSSYRSLESFVSITLTVVRQREKDAKEAKRKAKQEQDKASVLQQWYFSLGRALQQSGGPEPDFSFEMFADCFWIGGFDEDFVYLVIGDQLKEYGLELTTLEVVGFMDTAVWVCIGIPGQFDEWRK